VPNARPRIANRLAKAAAGLAVVVAILAPASPAAGTASTLYVGGPGCSDTGQGTQTQPFCSISKAAATVAPGQTVVVSGGSYAESVSVTKSGTAVAPIVFTVAQGATATVSGGTHGFALSNVSYVTVNGFAVTNTSASGIYLNKASFVTVSQNHVSYAGLPIEGATAAGIQVSAATDSLISGNVVDHNTVAGIYLTNGSTRVTVDENQASWNAFGYVRNAPGIDVRTAGNTITRNISHDNEDSGLQFYPGADNNLVAGNVSYHNKGFTQVQLTNCNHPRTGSTSGCITGDHGIDDLNVTGNRIIGNSIYDNVSAGINVEGTSSNFLIANNVSADNAINCPNGAGGTESCPRTTGNIRVDQNSTGGTTLHQDLVFLHLVAGQSGTMMTWKTSGYSTLAAFVTASGQEQAGVQADPMWVAPASGDMHLAAGSPAIDSADSAVDGELLSDIDGTQRVDDPATADTGSGGRTYDDRGAYEFRPGAATVPDAPSAAASAGLGTVQLSWTSPASGGSPITGYRVYRSTSPGGEGSQPLAQVGVVTSYQDSALTAGTTYYYQVSAVNNVGEGARSAEVSATPTTASAPDAPVVNASASSSSVGLSWTTPASGTSPIIGYRVYRSTSPGGEGSQPLAQVGVVTSYQDSAVTAGTTYYYQVSAVNSVGEGARSAEVSATPVAATNLVGNPGFEVNTTGWAAGSGNTLARATIAHTGSGAAVVTLVTAGNDTLLNDSPDWNKPTSAGTTCTATAWVQGPAGLKAVIRLREYQGTTLLSYVTTTSTLQGSTWMQVSVAVPVVSAGDNIDLNIYGKTFAVGQTLLVDDVTEVCQP
jgi:parallel beta-helix repeat protein